MLNIVNIPFHMQNQHEFDLFFTGNCHDRNSFAQIQSISRKFNNSCNERIFLWWIIYFAIAWNMFHTWFHDIFLNDTLVHAVHENFIKMLLLKKYSQVQNRHYFLHEWKILPNNPCIFLSTIFRGGKILRRRANFARISFAR